MEAPPAVVIVGTGFAGLGMAIRLRQSGFDDFVILEKADDVGGTWRDNTYPGCACDIPSVLYSFSFEQNRQWSRSYPEQQEIWDYLRRCTDKYGIRGHIRFGVEFLGASYDDETSRWRVDTSTGPVTTTALVLGVGALHKPAFPNLDGLSDFTGPVFHSAQWRHDVDLTGKRVAVVGTGASAVQFLPRIAPAAGQLDLYQRTPPWVIPKGDRPISALRRRLYRIPGAQRLARNLTFWSLDGRAAAFSGHSWLMAPAQAIARRHLRRQVPDPELRRKLTPQYAMGCKRILPSNDFYPALTRPNVDVVTDPITRVGARGVLTADGTERPADVLILGTGFQVVNGFDHLAIAGRDGRKLSDAWPDGPEAYLGITVAGFPNMFLLVGPNTGLGHNSMVFMIEAQIRYVAQCLRLLDSAGALEVRPEVQERFNARAQAKLKRSVWSVGGCRSWYIGPNGRNTSLWPGAAISYWRRTRRADPADFALHGRTTR